MSRRCGRARPWQRPSGRAAPRLSPRRSRRDAVGAARFRELLETSLAAAPTTLTEDRAMLSESTTLEVGYGLLRVESARLFHALTYRIGQKALITKMLEALESDDPAAAISRIASLFQSLNRLRDAGYGVNRVVTIVDRGEGGDAAGGGGVR